MNQKQYLTQEGYDKLVQELDYVKNVEQKKNIEDLQDARSQGDLSENADYDAAREEQAQIAARISTIEKILKNYELIQDGANNLGKWVKIEFLDLEDEDEPVRYSSLDNHFIKQEKEPEIKYDFMFFKWLKRFSF